jgi:PAS domain S-box-containing protein
MIMLTSTTAVLLACLGFAISDLVIWRHGVDGDLSTLAQVVGSNSMVALTFEDQQGAREVLNVLRAKPSIVAAGLYTEKGEPFARYEPNPAIAIPRVPLQDGFHDRGDHIELFYAIRLGRQRLGTLYIASDSRDRNAQLKQHGRIAAGIVLVSLLLAFVLSSRLQRNISEPIGELVRVASLVSQHRDYSMRADGSRLQSIDEIARLMTGFNSMLAEIEQRDLRLLVAKNAAEKAAAVNAQLARDSALFLNSATDGILGIGLDNRPTFLNPAAERILGMTLSDMEGKTIHEAIHHSYADGTQWPEADCANTQAIRRRESLPTAYDTYWRGDGTSFPVEYSSTPMFDERGNQCGSVVMFRDVTERRAIERLKSEFVSTVSHELRTPLTSIRGALGLLVSGLLGPTAEKAQRMLEIAVTNTDRLVRLINDILDLERIGSGKVELARGAVDASSVMMQAIEGLQSMADVGGVRLVLQPVSAALWGDSDRIIQTLTNLLGNAIKFSPPDTTVTLSGMALEAEFVFCVADEGRGVPEEKLGTIFERFSQVDASDSRDKGGSGLGLAICRSIVNAQGGRIWAEANEPKGSRFQFTMPLAVPPAAIESPDVTRDAHSILLVEDDLDLARVMTTALQRHGLRIVHAAKGSDAIGLCRQHVPSLIVLEVALPDIDGFAVVSALRKSGAALAGIPLVVYSAMDVGSADQLRLRLGPTEFLTKSRCSLAEFEEHVVRLAEAVAKRMKEDQDAA